MVDPLITSDKRKSRSHCANLRWSIAILILFIMITVNSTDDTDSGRVIFADESNDPSTGEGFSTVSGQSDQNDQSQMDDKIGQSPADSVRTPSGEPGSIVFDEFDYPDSMDDSMENEQSPVPDNKPPWLIRVNPELIDEDPGLLFKRYYQGTLTLLDRVRWTGNTANSDAEVIKELLNKVFEWYDQKEITDERGMIKPGTDEDMVRDLVRYVCIALVMYSNSKKQIPFPVTVNSFNPENLFDAVDESVDSEFDVIIQQVLEEYQMSDHFQNPKRRQPFQKLWARKWSDTTFTEFRDFTLEKLEKFVTDDKPHFKVMKEFLQSENDQAFWRSLSNFWVGTDRLPWIPSINIEVEQMISDGQVNPVIHVDRCTQTLFIPTSLTPENVRQSFSVINELFQPLLIDIDSDIQIDFNDQNPKYDKIQVFKDIPTVPIRSGKDSRRMRKDMMMSTFNIDYCEWKEISITVKSIQNDDTFDFLLRDIGGRFKRNWYDNFDRTKFKENPAHVFDEHKLVMLGKVSWIGERGVGCGLKQDWLTVALNYYRESKNKITGNNGMIQTGEKMENIRDFTRFLMICLISEAEGDGNIICPITHGLFSPWNIWLAMADRDTKSDQIQNNHKLKEWYPNAGKKIFPDNDAMLPDYYDEIGQPIEDREPSLRDFIRTLNSESSFIIRQVLAEYQMLSLMEYYYRKGTLIKTLNGVWKKNWSDEDSDQLKARVKHIVENQYYSSDAEKSAANVFGDWVAAQRSDDHKTMAGLYFYWTAASVYSESIAGKLRMNFRKSGIHASNCFQKLTIPLDLNQNNVGTIMSHALASVQEGFQD